MKKYIRIICILMSLSMILSISMYGTGAETVYTCDDYSYIYTDQGKAEIISYSGTETELKIPAELNGRAVVSIGASAFSKSQIKSVEFPEGLLNISQYAFFECPNLVSVKLPSTLKTIGLSAFYQNFSLESINLEDTQLQYVSMMTFSGCTYLDNIKLPQTCTGIYSGAFAYCISLENIYIPKSVENIADNAFSNTGRVTVTGYHNSYADEFCSQRSITFIPISISCLLGDANKDDTVNITDCTYIQRCLAKIHDTTDYVSVSGDADEDGKLSINDVTAIQKYLCRIDVTQVAPNIGTEITKFA